LPKVALSLPVRLSRLADLPFRPKDLAFALAARRLFEPDRRYERTAAYPWQNRFGQSPPRDLNPVILMECPLHLIHPVAISLILSLGYSKQRALGIDTPEIALQLALILCVAILSLNDPDEPFLGIRVIA